jgi:Holliday junction resolvase-like predicted endonuclease
MYVKKFDGSKQQFDKNRIIRTCMRNGASEETATKIANRIEKNAHDGMRTQEILDLIWEYLREHHPESQMRVDLRLALSLLRSKPDFENYASLILKDLGYSVQSNMVLRGRCIEHEIDAIAQKEDRTIYVEVKHHNRAHTYTPLEVSMKVWATLQDLIAGKKLGYHNINFTKALIICNTKFTDHARVYADCVGIDHIGWKSPVSNGLEDIIERRSLYPVTVLKEDRGLLRLLVGNGVLLLRQLIEEDAERLARNRIVSTSQLSALREKSRRILNQLKAS